MKKLILFSIFLSGFFSIALFQVLETSVAASLGDDASKRLTSKLPTIYVVGDSTAAKAVEPRQGWGEPFVAFFDLNKVNVLNLARGGCSSRTFITEGWWGQLQARLNEGDLVLIQFGHNDAGAINIEPVGSKELRARGTLPGLGDESEEIDNALTGEHEVVHTYGWYIRKMIAEVRAKGAIPILLSPTARNIWKDGRVEQGIGHYREWDYLLAQEARIDFIDLTQANIDQYQKLGQSRVAALFINDHTHTNVMGAQMNAEYVVLGLKKLRGALVKNFLSVKGKSVKNSNWIDIRPVPRSQTLEAR